MENISQQTDESSYDDPRPWRTRMWPLVWPLAISICFVALALLFSIIYKGLGSRNHYLPGSHSHKIKPLNIQATLSSVDKYPFVGALTSHKPYLFLCSVVIITSRYLLTGANCFTTNFPNLWVTVGSDVWDHKNNEYSVQTFIINEEFDGTNLENNVALVKLKVHITMDGKISPVKMKTTPTVEANNGIVLGWNYWNMAERQYVRLFEQKLLIWNPARCRKYLGNETSSKFICASLSNTLCNLDVTGPFIVDGKLVGFWSWGLSCTDVPSVFTNIHYFESWISNKTRS